MLKERLDRIKKNSFIRSVAVLVGGTMVAQAITMGALPILTRLYTPDDFSILAVYAALLSIISVAACLRLEIAIPLPESDYDAANLLILALVCVFLVSILIVLLVWLVPDQLIALLKQPGLRPYIWILPLGVWLAGSYSALQLWAIRQKAFTAISRTRINQSSAGAGVQIALGWAGYAPFGLLIGQVLNQGAGIIGLGFLAFGRHRSLFRDVSNTNMRRLLHVYRRFPQYSTFESLANNAATQMPVIIIAALAAGPQAGYLMLAMRVMQAPMGLIGGSISQVYLSHAPAQLRAGKIGEFTASVLGGLIKTGAGPLVFIGIVSPDIFVLIFGESWRRAGVLVAWMTPWFIMQFLASPISMALHVTNNQKKALGLQIFGLLLRTTCVLAVAYFDSQYITEAYAVSGFIFYTVYLFVILKLTNVRVFGLISQMKAAFVPLISWLFLSAIVTILTKLISRHLALF